MGLVTSYTYVVAIELNFSHLIFTEGGKQKKSFEICWLNKWVHYLKCYLRSRCWVDLYSHCMIDVHDMFWLIKFLSQCISILLYSAVRPHLICIWMLQVGRRIYVQITRINEDTNDLILSEKEAWVCIFHLKWLPAVISSLFLAFLFMLTSVYALLLLLLSVMLSFLAIQSHRRWCIFKREHFLKEQSGKFFRMVRR